MTSAQQVFWHCVTIQAASGERWTPTDFFELYTEVCRQYRLLPVT